MGGFVEILRLVIADPGLTRELASAANEAELFPKVIALGRSHGIEVTVAELEEITRANRRAWLERWLPW